MPKHTSLTDNQIREIIRLRFTGKAYKEIARLISCTPEQARHYWREGRQRVRRLTSSQKAFNQTQAANRKRVQLTQAHDLHQSKLILAQEIAQAKSESTTSPIYKYRGLLPTQKRILSKRPRDDTQP